MPAAITDLLAHLHRDHARLGITLYPPAEEVQLLALERRKGIKLPVDVREFYRFCDGFESAEDPFRIIPLGEIPAVDRHTVALSDFHVAEYLQYCDMWTLSVNSLDPQTYTIYNWADDTVTLTTSFTEFLAVFLNSGVFGTSGLYDWREATHRQLLAELSAFPFPSPLPHMEELNQLAESTRQKLGLHYDAEGVKFVEGFIERNKGSLEPEEWPGLVNSLGAFLGCCILRNYGGQWQTDDEHGFCVAFDAQNKVFPFAKTAKQFESGLVDSVYFFYTAIPVVFNRAALVETPAPPRKPWYKFW